jgi:chaperonin GroES
MYERATARAASSGIFHRQQHINHLSLYLPPTSNKHISSSSNLLSSHPPPPQWYNPHHRPSTTRKPTQTNIHHQSTIAAKSIKALAPLLDRVLVQRIKAETKTAGGIFLPESAVKELNEAKVLAVGPGAFDRDGKRIAPSVQPGDKVLIPQFGGSPIKVGEDEYSLFRDHE